MKKNVNFILRNNLHIIGLFVAMMFPLMVFAQTLILLAAVPLLGSLMLVTNTKQVIEGLLQNFKMFLTSPLTKLLNF